jgi:Cu/Zn superoxide dismutase
MRNRLGIALALAVAGGIAACGGGDEAELDTLDTEEAVEPAAETPGMAEATEPAAPQPLITADFQIPEEAESTVQITGTVEVYPTESDYGVPAPPTPAPSEADEGEAEDEGATEPETTATAEASPAGEGFRLEVEIEGLSEGPHAWHIHDGPCGETAGIAVALTTTQDAEGITQPLNATAGAPASGTVTVAADRLTLDQLETGEYSLHVHAQGGTDHGPTVACADLGEETNDAM